MTETVESTTPKNFTNTFYILFKWFNLQIAVFCINAESNYLGPHCDLLLLGRIFKSNKNNIRNHFTTCTRKIIFKICATNEWFIQVWKHYNIIMYFYMKAFLFRQTVRFMYIVTKHTHFISGKKKSSKANNTNMRSIANHSTFDKKTIKYNGWRTCYKEIFGNIEMIWFLLFCFVFYHLETVANPGFGNEVEGTVA